MCPRPLKEQMLSLADIARHFSLPESTARYYCKRFAAFMPSQGEGRRKRYRQESLAVVAAILEHMRTARTAAGVEEVLRQQFPCTTDAIVPAQSVAVTSAAPAGMPAGESGQDMLPVLALRLLEQQTRAMEGIAASLQQLTRRQEELQLLTDAARTASEQNIAMQQEIQHMRTLLHSSEKMHQDDLDQIRVWVARMAKRGSGAQPAAENSKA